MATAEEVKQQIDEQTAAIAALKKANAPKDQIQAAAKKLLELKAQYKTFANNNGGNQKANTGSKKNFTLKTPKGTKDYNDKEMAVREKIFNTIKTVFKRHGAVTIDTPVFELKEILMGKYGEDSKLIYDLQDQGGELCSLRYDLTVPFARFVAMNGSKYQNIKRYNIAKVYRRDQPSVARGRMREFVQCDFDIAGVYEPMVPDAEIVRIMKETLTALDIGDFTIKINHRKILDGMFEFCGVPKEKFRTISSAVDKLDKAPWEEVRKEMVELKGLPAEVADKIGTFVVCKGGREMCEFLEEKLGSNATAMEGINDMKLLMTYLEAFDVLDKISFDLSLARGLDYYTGVIYEAVSTAPPETGKKKKSDDEGSVGSVSGGGRYDNLVGMFSGNRTVPCVGFSIGVERIFSILLRKMKLEEVKANEVQVYVCSVGKGLLTEKMKICKELWDNDIKAEFMYKADPKLDKQFQVCEREKIPYAIIIGNEEIEKQVVKIKDQTNKESGNGEIVPRSEYIEYIKKLLNQN